REPARSDTRSRCALLPNTDRGEPAGTHLAAVARLKGTTNWHHLSRHLPGLVGGGQLSAVLIRVVEQSFQRGFSDCRVGRSVASGGTPAVRVVAALATNPRLGTYHGHAS